MPTTLRKPSVEDCAVEAALLHLIELNRDMPSGRRDRMYLRLASQLCERAAYRRAGVWPAGRVAELIELSARIERITLDGSELN